MVSYSYVITNTGNTTIMNALTISDDRISTVTCPTLPAGGLLPNATLTCTGTDIVTQADIDAGSITNIATGTDGIILTPPVSENITADQTPDLALVKTALTADFDAVGDLVDYEYVVTNTGNVTIASPITVTDDKIPSVSCPALPGGTLAPNATLTCTGTYSITQADIDAGSVVNMASATDGTITTSTVTETVNSVQQPELSIVKTANETSFSTVGDVLSYDYVVRNTGNVTLTGAITVTDNLIPTVSCPSVPTGGLVPNATITCTATYLVTQANIDAGSVTNIASASDGTTTSPTDTATVSASQGPALTTVKTAHL